MRTPIFLPYTEFCFFLLHYISDKLTLLYSFWMIEKNLRPMTMTMTMTQQEDINITTINREEMWDKVFLHFVALERNERVKKIMSRLKRAQHFAHHHHCEQDEKFTKGLRNHFLDDYIFLFISFSLVINLLKSRRWKKNVIKTKTKRRRA
jgi:hypothetical protein